MLKIVINWQMSLTHTFYLAPLQGFTDFVYRKCYHQLFDGIDGYFIPYISIGKGGEIRKSQFREILPENNEQVPVVPQILCANVVEMRLLANEIKRFGYERINLNLGCPYPMATKRGRGTGLLESPENLRMLLDALFTEFNFKVSVKFRGGLIDERTIFERVDLLNDYPFDQLIFHPRTAKQMYNGIANRELFAELSKSIQRTVMYNGDIQSVEDLDEIRNLVPGQNQWMIGRGILSNPFLPAELKGESFTKDEKREKLIQFHELILENHLQTWSDHGIALTKLEQFWTYFSHSFVQEKKIYKAVKKAKNITAYRNGIAPFLNEIV